MGGRWNPSRFQFCCLIFIFSLLIQGSLSLNHEGLALLEFRDRIDSDPHGSVASWNPLDRNPCMWVGVHCVDDKVHMLDLSELSLEGSLAPELGKLHNLRSLLLNKNRFSGTIPKEIGDLKELELLDLRDNNLGGSIPGEMGSMQSLKRLLLCQNKFEGSIPSNLGRLGMLSELQFDPNLTCSADSEIHCVNRKLGHCTWHGSSNQLSKAESFLIPIKGAILNYLNLLPMTLFKLLKGSHTEHKDYADATGSSAQHMVQNARNIVRIVRRRLLEQNQNLAAAPASGGSADDQIIAQPITRGSGSFPAVPKDKQSPPQSPPKSPTSDAPPSQGNTSDQSSGNEKAASSSGNLWKYLIIIPCAVFLIAILVMIFVCRKRGKVIGPWKTGISGQLQKAFVTGVPKLNRTELETACEDFSNIIDTIDGCTIYKGTLSSGVEIAVASASVTSLKDWSSNSEIAYRRKIDTLSRVNHKNFVNLIGFCEEDEPFIRMMVFEYAPNGNLFEHLHVKEMEHLDWTTRMRVIMGIAYCLQYMHHDLNPPVAHSHLTSKSVFLTDDYAAKVAEVAFGPHSTAKPKISGDDNDNESENSISELPPNVDPETNIYNFGVMLLEIISGKLPYTEEDGPIEKWASKYLGEEKNVIYMVDPSLKSCKNEELYTICDIVRDCIQSELRQRPTMKDIITKLRQVITISPDQATPKLSPLWWAELEILSVEAT